MTLDRDQSVDEMVEEVLARQAKSLAAKTGQPFERVLRIVADTEAGRQLRELAHGEHGHKKAREWQANVIWKRSEERLMHLFASDALSRFAPVCGGGRKERTMRKMHRAGRKEQPPVGAQVAFARVATGLAWTSLGALAVGASAAGAVAIGALAIRALAVKRGRIQRLDIEELEVGRLHVRELVVEQEQRPVVGQEQTPPPPQASE